MLPGPDLVQAQVVGEVGRVGGSPSVDPAHRDAPVAEACTEQDLFDALVAGAYRTELEERQLRTEAWWRGNDPDRSTAGTPRERRQVALDNMKRLHASIEVANNEDRLLKAELARQLGSFEEASILLTELVVEPGEASTQLANVRGFMLGLASLRSTALFEVPPAPKTRGPVFEERDDCEVSSANPPCPSCGRPLRTDKAQQCFACGADWHSS